MTLTKKFKNANGLYYTKALFLEQAHTNQDRDLILYTLHDEDYKGYPSFYRLYMEVSDPTEYQFATQYLDGWGHWEDLCLCPWFKTYIERWRRELEVRIRSQALSRISSAASSSDNKSRIPANKYLLSGEWLPKGRAGRPTKEMVQKETKRLAEVSRQIDEDLLRVEAKKPKEDDE